MAIAERSVRYMGQAIANTPWTRSAVAHFLSLALFVWGGFLAAREVEHNLLMSI